MCEPRLPNYAAALGCEHVPRRIRMRRAIQTLLLIYALPTVCAESAKRPLERALDAEFHDGVTITSQNLQQQPHSHSKTYHNGDTYSGTNLHLTIPSPLSESSCDDSSSDNDPLACWLSGIEISLPDISEKQGFVVLTLTNLICTHVQLGGLSSFQLSSSVSLHLDGLSIECSGHYSVMGTVGKLAASVSSSSTLGLTLKFNPDPTQYRAESCGVSCYSNFEIRSEDVLFSGSLSANLIQLFRSPIAKALGDMLNSGVCPELVSGLEEGLGTVLEGVNEAMDDIIGGALPEEYVDEEVEVEGVLSWQRDVPLLFKVLVGMNTFLHKHLDTGFTTLPQTALDTFASSTFPPLTLDALDVNVPSWEVPNTWNHGPPLTAQNNLRPSDFVGGSQIQAPSEYNACGKGFLLGGIDGWIASVTNGTGIIEVDLRENSQPNSTRTATHIPALEYSFTYQSTVVTISLQTVSVSGLDALTNATFFAPRGYHSAMLAVGAPNLGLTLGLHLTVQPTDTSTGDGEDDATIHTGTLEQTFSIALEVDDVYVEAELVAHVGDSMSNLTMGTIFPGLMNDGNMDRNRTLPHCFWSTVSTANVTNVRANMTVHTLRISPDTTPTSTSPTQDSDDSSLSAQLDEFVDNLIHLFLSDYQPLVSDFVQGVFQNPLRHALNDYLAHSLAQAANEPCEVAPNNSTPHYLQFDTHTNNPFANLDSDDAGVEKANAVLQCVDDETSESHLLEGVFYELVVGDCRLELRDLRVVNLESVYEFDLIKPEIDPYHLYSSFGMGGCHDTNGSNQKNHCATNSSAAGTEAIISFSLTCGTGFTGNDGGTIDGHGNITLGVRNAVIQGGTLLQYDLNSLAGLPLEKLLSKPSCSVVPLTKLEFYDVGASVEQVEVAVDLVLERDFGGDEGSGGEVIAEEYNLRLDDEVTDMVNKMNELTKALEQIVNDLVYRTLQQAPYNCGIEESAVDTHDTDQDDEFTTASPALIWIPLGLVLIFGCLPLCVAKKWIFGGETDFRFDGDDSSIVQQQRYKDGDGSARTQDTQLESLFSRDWLSGNNNRIGIVSAEEAHQHQKEFSFGGLLSDQLMFHPSVPSELRHTLPVLTILIIILFVTSNIAIGASVDAVLSSQQTGQESDMKLNGLFEFSLGKTVREMYEAGVYALMLLILVFTGIWPYVKLVLMLFAYIVPQDILPQSTREELFVWLDALGKFSLVDTYVMVLFLVAFRFHLVVDEQLAVDVFVNPNYGFYSFLLATILSLIMGHVFLYYHRQSTAVKEYPKSNSNVDGSKENLIQHAFDTRYNPFRIQFSIPGKVILTILFTSSVLLLGIGIQIESFQLEFKGLAGLFLGKDSIQSYSLVSLGQAVNDSAQNPGSFGIRCIQFAFFIFSVLMPFTCLALIGILLFVPLTGRIQSNIFSFAEVTNAWSAIEVFVLSIAAALLQISKFAAFMVGDSCDTLNRLLEHFFDDVLEQDDVCFDVQASVGIDSWVLFIGTLLNSLTTYCVLKFAHEALHNRLEREGCWKEQDNGDIPTGTSSRARNDHSHTSASKSVSFVEGIYQSCLCNVLFKDTAEVSSCPEMYAGSQQVYKLEDHDTSVYCNDSSLRSVFEQQAPLNEREAVGLERNNSDDSCSGDISLRNSGDSTLLRS